MSLQQQQTVGHQSTAVQVAGDGNTVTIGVGSASLALTRPQNRRRTDPRTELELLRVDVRATTLVGRAAEDESLDAWLDGDGPIAFRCLVARAGTGKTRLAVELCERADKAGWTAGFVQNGPFQEFVRQAADWRWTVPTLVVVDYAASFARDLRTWLEILAAGHYPYAPKLRVLLLERHADAELGWFADLLRVTSFSAPSPADLADPPLPVPLASLDKLEDRRALLAETMRIAGTIAGKAEPPCPPARSADPEFDRRLADDTIDNEPLYLMMAGAEAVRTGAPAALRLTRTDLARRAAARERARLERLAAQGGVPPALLTHLALCVTLQGGCDPEAAEALLGEEVEALSLPSPLAPVETIGKLAEAMPASASREIDALRPDLVGEAFVLDAIRAYSAFPVKETAIVARAWRRAPSKVTATLVRTAQDFSRGDPAHESVRWLDALVDDMRDLSEVLAFLAAMPDETVALCEVAASASQRAVKLFRVFEHHSEFMPHIASALASMATRLRAIGRREAALGAANEAANIRRELAGQWPDAFQPDLAMSLNTLAIMLSAVGQREAALDAAREAAIVYRQLATQRPEIFQDDLAGSLNNLAAMLSEVGQPEAALDAVLGAVDAYRQLEADRPEAFRPNLAGSLMNLTKMLSETGQYKAALKAAHEAVDIWRKVAAHRPDAFRPDLAASLISLTRVLSEVGEFEMALEAAREAADVCRELASQRPEAFGPKLAGSLNNLANMLSQVGRREAALAAAREAAAVYRELASQWPDAFRPNLAGSLNNLAALLSEVGQHEAALDAAREAAEIRGELATQRPDAFLPELAISLAVLALCLSASNSPSKARASSADAVDTLAVPFFARPLVFAGLMQQMLCDHIAYCEDAGTEPEAARLNPIIKKLNELSGDSP